MYYFFLLFYFLFQLILITYVLYFIQIKEYRFDRVLTAIKEFGIFKIIYPGRFVKPKLTKRIINIYFIIVGCLFVYFASSIYVIFWLKLVMTMFAPVASLSFMLVGLWYTAFSSKKAIAKEIQSASEKLQLFKPKVIGITGSFGKSSTKDYLSALLSSKVNVVATQGNFNTAVGIALSINKQLSSRIQYFVAEMGAYKLGEIADMCAFVNPDIAILTSLGNQHVSLFGSQQKLVEAKSELLQAIPKNGQIYLTKDSNYTTQLLAACKCKHIKTFSVQDQSADIYLVEASHIDNLLIAEVYSKAYGKIVCSTHLIGKHSLTNLLPCIELALDLGLSKLELISAIKMLHPLPGKLSAHKGINHSTILNDSYNSNLHGFLVALDTFFDLFPAKKLIVVSKGVIELGSEKNQAYSSILAKLKAKPVTFFTTDSLFKKLDTNSVTLISSEHNLLNKLLTQLDSETALLVEGRFTDKFVASLLNYD